MTKSDTPAEIERGRERERELEIERGRKGERETERERERESSIPLSKCLPYLAPTRQYHAAKGTEGRDVEKCFVVQCGEG